MKEKGFTLIELMIVVIIVGVLVSIAIPMFSEFRIKAFNSVALSDVKNGIEVIEDFMSLGNNFPDTQGLFTGAGTLFLTDGTITKALNVSQQVSILYTRGIGGGYCLIAKHFAGDVIYMASDITSVPVALTQAASWNVKLNDTGAIPAVLNCSGMSKGAVALIGVN